ncbi:MAG: hypothetical protein FWH12_08955 [Treponema sp.]|nr:hypothetical protein [Treponema sp.]
MNHKRLVFLVCLCIILGLPLSASMVSFFLVETGIPDSSPNTQYTRIWEDGLMDAFFEAGHIVTNSPASRFDTEPSSEICEVVEFEFNEAVEGGAEYFIVGYLRYETNGPRQIPQEITLQVYSTQNSALLHVLYFPAGSGRDNQEEFQIAKNAGWVVITQMRNN